MSITAATNRARAVIARCAGACLLAAFAAAAATTAAATFGVRYAVDGDSIHYTGNSQARLLCIDAPEYSQPHGKQATRALQKHLERGAAITPRGRDQQRRRLVLLADAQGDSINLALVRDGHAWVSRRAGGCALPPNVLDAAEREARNAKRGLWRAANPIPPWQWRQQNKFEPRYAHAVDGNTLQGAGNSQARLLCIDAPESSQPHGKQATRALQQHLERGAAIIPRGRDGQRRRLVLLLDTRGKSINLALLRAGHARVSRRYADSCGLPPRALYAAEGEARRAKRGLWGAQHPTPTRQRRQWNKFEPRYAVDGDSIQGAGKSQARLLCIDAPEYSQPHGKQATRALQKHLKRAPTIKSRGRDRHQRLLVLLTDAQGKSVNLALVRDGHAWVARRYALSCGLPPNALYAAEGEARRAGRGLWSDLGPIPPWQWRRLNKKR